MILVTLVAAATPTSDVSIRGMIREAREIILQSGGQLWAGYPKIPLPLLLIDEKQERLFCGQPAAGFRPAGIDRVTGCPVQRRPRQLPVDLAAATDLDQQSVIEIGLPSAVGLSRPEWIVTLVHETFHQYQANIPSYNRTVADVGRHLGTSGTDWILGYSFPYKQPNVVATFKVMTDRALAFLSNRLADKDRQLIADYLKARRAARAASGDVAWVYAEFQIGQEGVARWTELTLGRRASRTDAAVAAVAADRWAGLTTSLRAINDQGLAIWKRNAFYVLGAVEAEMLDRVKPDWRDAYVRHPFSLGQQLEDCCGEADPSSETASG